MDEDLTPDQRAFLAEVRDFLTAHVTPALRAELAEYDLEFPGGEVSAFRAAVGRRGWFGINWPTEYGGLGLSPVHQHLLVNEFEFWGVPGPDLTVTSVAPMIMRHGTEQNRQEFLPPIARGEMTCAVGYSEPHAGTDLAALSTRAVRDGDQWVINGSKIWNSMAQRVTHEWLCVRTDPAAPKHKGISVIIVPIDIPGIEVRPIITWGDFRTNETFFTDVRVPATNLIGEENRGWQYITGALDLERGALTNAGDLRRAVDELIRAIRAASTRWPPPDRRPLGARSRGRAGRRRGGRPADGAGGSRIAGIRRPSRRSRSAPRRSSPANCVNGSRMWPCGRSDRPGCSPTAATMRRPAVGSNGSTGPRRCSGSVRVPTKCCVTWSPSADTDCRGRHGDSSDRDECHDRGLARSSDHRRSP